jgi:hypothetical protein
MRPALRRALVLIPAFALFAVPAMAGAVGGFNGPLFGLSTATNGDILVADASVGIHAVRDGAVVSTVDLPGVTDMSPFGRGGMWAVTGAGADPTADTGQGVWRITGGQPQLIANLYEFEAQRNPDGNDPPDSNPFDVHALNNARALVADAGANALLRANKQGGVAILAVFPDSLVSTENIKSLAGCPESGADFCFLPDMMPAQSVPTSVTVGPDGYYYVGELRGFPAPTGESSVWRVSPNASRARCGASPDCVKVFDGGFTSIIDLNFAPDGTLTVAELDEASWAAVEIFQSPTGGTINSCDLSSLTCSEVATGIPILTATTYDAEGDLWATQNALIPGLAEVFEVGS